MSKYSDQWNTIEQVTSYKYLGLILNSTLTWDAHIKSITTKV